MANEETKPQANLGLATTEELLNEIRSRIEIDYFSGGGGLQYTTVDGRPEIIAMNVRSRYPDELKSSGI